MKVFLFHIIIVLLVLSDATAQSASEADSTDVIIKDSLSAVPDPAIDSLAGDTTLGLSFEERYKEFKETQQERQVRVSFFDSLVTYFTSERLNLKSTVDQSFVRDAGDYFKFDPSFFVQEYHLTPMRKTVQPFNLIGDYLNYMINDFQLNPFEHLPETDYLNDMNDFPLGGNEDIYILPGAAGMIFGGENAVASIITRPKNPEDNDAYTGINADSGPFDYSYTRGKYSRNFVSGKMIDLSIGYRDALGIEIGTDDASYHYVSDFFFPIGTSKGLSVFGQLYDREGNFMFHRDAASVPIRRERFDRNVKIDFESLNKASNSRTIVSYQHLRQGSYTTLNYLTRFNITGHAASLGKEWVADKKFMKAEIKTTYRKYDQGLSNHIRYSSNVTFKYAKLNDNFNYSLLVDGKLVESFGVMPSLMFYLFKDSKNSMLSFSLGLKTKEPSLDQLFETMQRSSLYGISNFLIFDIGNERLKPEKQLIANLTYERGSQTTNINLQFTGGKIFDGIQRAEFFPSSKFKTTPYNQDMTFYNLRLKAKLLLGQTLSLHAGGAYNYLKNNKDKSTTTTTEPIKTYFNPKYQAFSGVQLHYFWKRKLAHLFAYAELSYRSEYEAFSFESINTFGNDIVVNSKISFKIKDFRFSYIFENSISTKTILSDSQFFTGQFSYYNITWNFLD